MNRRELLKVVPLGMLSLGCLSVNSASAAPVPPGTPVMLQFMETISTKTAQKGDKIRLRVYTNVVVDGKTLIAQDAPGVGVVTEVRRPGGFGKRGRLKIRLDNVQAIDGSRVALEAYKSGERFSAEGPGAATAGLVVLGPVGLVGGAFIKGKHVTIDEGTRIQARVPGGPKEKSGDQKPKSEKSEDTRP